jgi:uncharacterized protein YndB with AHSA1/START domain
MTSSETDKIEKNVVLSAPRSRVWKAIADSKQFGEWFEMEMSGPFEPGAKITGTIKSAGKYQGITGIFVVDRVEPEKLFSFRWHPYAVERNVDYSSEPMTLVTFELEEAKEGTRLRIVESGFDAIPQSRRALAFRMNSQGWGIQIENIARFIGG